MIFKRSSNDTKAIINVQQMRISGDSVHLSMSQIVMQIISLQDAKRYLPQEDFERVYALFYRTRKDKRCVKMDYPTYLKYCQHIICDFEEIAPYLLFDGNISQNLEMRDQIRIFAMHAQGIRYPESAEILSAHRETIDCTSYEMVHDAEGKQMLHAILGAVKECFPFDSAPAIVKASEQLSFAFASCEAMLLIIIAKKNIIRRISSI